MLSKKVSPAIKKKAFEKMVKGTTPIYKSKYKNGGSVFTVEGSEYNSTELGTAKSLADKGQNIIFPNKGHFGKHKGEKKIRNDVFMIDTKTYYMQKLELKALTGKSWESIAKQVSKGQAPVIAYDILSTIKKGNLIKGLKAGWNADIRKVIVKWKGNWHEIEHYLLFSEKIYTYLK